MVRSILLSAILAVAACATAGGESGTALTGSELTALLSGNTVKGSNFTEYYAAGGVVRGIEAGKTYAGSWRIEGDTVCLDFPSYSYQDCLAVRKDGDAYRLIGTDKKVKVTILEGNAQSL